MWSRTSFYVVVGGLPARQEAKPVVSLASRSRHPPGRLDLWSTWRTRRCGGGPVRCFTGSVSSGSTGNPQISMSLPWDPSRLLSGRRTKTLLLLSSLRNPSWLYGVGLISQPPRFLTVQFGVYVLYQEKLVCCAGVTMIRDLARCGKGSGVEMTGVTLSSFPRGGKPHLLRTYTSV